VSRDARATKACDGSTTAIVHDGKIAKRRGYTANAPMHDWWGAVTSRTGHTACRANGQRSPEGHLPGCAEAGRKLTVDEIEKLFLTRA